MRNRLIQLIDPVEVYVLIIIEAAIVFIVGSESHFTLLTSNLGRSSGVHDYIKERTIKIGKYIVETRKTVRVIAKEFGVSKSTVHKDLTERLPEINPELATLVKDILDYHKSIRHLRGGEATKLKYKRSDREEEIVK